MTRAWLVLALVAAGCHDVQPCRPSTLFVDLAAGAGASGADGLRIEVQSGGQTLRDRLAYAGQSSVGLEIDFPNGYPTGQTVVVTVTAQHGSDDLASGTASVRLDKSCARLPLTLAAIVAPVDMAMGPDLVMPPPCTHITSAFAQPLDASWALLGNARDDTNNARVVLNDSATGVTGALFRTAPVALWGLDATFTAFIGSGSDGEALVLTPSRPLAFPADADGAGIGYMGLPGWAIELDTYNNADHGDPDGNHVAFVRASDGKHLVVAHSTLTLACECSRQVHVKLTQTHVHVDLDGLAVLDGDLPNDGSGLPQIAGSWILGWTAAAGGAAAMHTVSDINVAAGAPGNCF